MRAGRQGMRGWCSAPAICCCCCCSLARASGDRRAGGWPGYFCLEEFHHGAGGKEALGCWGHPWVQAAPRRGSPRLLIPSPRTDPEPLSRGGCLAGAQKGLNPSLALPCPLASLCTTGGAPFRASLLGFLPLPRTAALVSISPPGAYGPVMGPAPSRSFPGGSPGKTPAGDP